MPQTKRNRFALLSLYVVAAVGVALAALHAKEGEAPHAAPAVSPAMSHTVGEMVLAAEAWWNSLTPEEQAKAHFEFTDDQRFDWHFIPRVRKGLPWKEMTPAQRALAEAFLATGLSTRAVMQAHMIMSLEQILKDTEAGPPKTPVRDPENYSYTIFGKPSMTGTWAWRVEGHHFAMNLTIVNGHAVGGPVFLGTNPAEVREGPRKGLRVLAEEDDQGHAMIRSCNDEQKKKAIIQPDAPKEMFTAANRKADLGAPVGLAFGDMNEAQQKMVKHLVDHYAHRLRAAMAADDLEKIEKAGWDKVKFAWAGGIEEGQGHYYRIHGPSFLIEFDDVQNNANHVHSVWRDSANDFGEDLLKAHYQANAH